MGPFTWWQWFLIWCVAVIIIWMFFKGAGMRNDAWDKSMEEYHKRMKRYRENKANEQERISKD